MKKLATFLFLFFTMLLMGQNSAVLTPKEGFNSVFAEMRSGNFSGTASGVLFLKNEKNKEIILDFQASKATFFLKNDSEEIYDVSFKNYQTATTSGKTMVTYTYYALANELKISLNDEVFEITTIDGACDMAINGLDYHFKAEKDTEYLVLNFKKEVVLQSAKKNKLRVQPHSVLMFAIKRN